MSAPLSLITHWVILGVLDFILGAKGGGRGPLVDVNGSGG